MIDTRYRSIDSNNESKSKNNSFEKIAFLRTDFKVNYSHGAVHEVFSRDVVQLVGDRKVNSRLRALHGRLEEGLDDQSQEPG